MRRRFRCHATSQVLQARLAETAEAHVQATPMVARAVSFKLGSSGSEGIRIHIDGYHLHGQCPTAMFGLFFAEFAPEYPLTAIW